MADASQNPTLKTDGKFFQLGSKRIWLRTVTYGPFPEEKARPHVEELGRIRSANFNSIRLFSLPDQDLLDAAAAENLLVFAGLDWRHYEDFISRPVLVSSAKIQLTEWLRKHASHPALAGIYIGNEIPSDLVRWMEPIRVRKTLEDLIDSGREIAPHLLFAYANYPSTEYLELGNADFTAFNIYLEKQEAFTNYLRRLQNIAGDRPLVVSEFGLDSLRSSPEIQASTLGWAMNAAHTEQTAGFTVFSWSDLWRNNGEEILDWNFGITDRNGMPKPSFDTCKNFTPNSAVETKHKFSIIICTRNGAQRISGCLNAIRNLAGGPYETIVVDDGSTDQTSEIVSKSFPEVSLISIPPSGLSAARNIGAASTSGNIFAFTDDDCEPDIEWIQHLDHAFNDPKIASAGGPNLPPEARNAEEAIIRASPGAPSHVLLDDTRAEHLPGCNIAVRKDAFEKIGGFDPAFCTAGDDVDFCWRLRDADFELGFAAGAFVWHWRRPSIRAFLKQQIGYGRAERILIKKHPERFSKNGEARWDGFVYSGGAIRVDHGSLIYYGPMGQAGYQSISNRMLPIRALETRFQNPISMLILRAVHWLQPMIRSWSRNRRILLPKFPSSSEKNSTEPTELSISSEKTIDRNNVLDHLISQQWIPAGDSDSWDLEKDGTRILIATERYDNQYLNHLFRVWGNAETARNAVTSFLIPR